MATREGNYSSDGLWGVYKMNDMLTAVQKAYGKPKTALSVGGYTPQEINRMYERQGKMPSGVFTSAHLYHAKKAVDAYRLDNGMSPRLERLQVQTERKNIRMAEIRRLLALGVLPDDIARQVDVGVKTVRRVMNGIKKEQQI